MLMSKCSQVASQPCMYNINNSNTKTQAPPFSAVITVSLHVNDWRRGEPHFPPPTPTLSFHCNLYSSQVWPHMLFSPKQIPQLKDNKQKKLTPRFLAWPVRNTEQLPLMSICDFFFFSLMLTPVFYLLGLSTPCGLCGDVGTLRASPRGASVLSPLTVDSACWTCSPGCCAATTDTPCG